MFNWSSRHAYFGNTVWIKKKKKTSCIKMCPGVPLCQYMCDQRGALWHRSLVTKQEMGRGMTERNWSERTISVAYKTESKLLTSTEPHFIYTHYYQTMTDRQPKTKRSIMMIVCVCVWGGGTGLWAARFTALTDFWLLKLCIKNTSIYGTFCFESDYWSCKKQPSHSPRIDQTSEYRECV